MLIVHNYSRSGHQMSKAHRKAGIGLEYTLVMSDLPTYDEARAMMIAEEFLLEVSVGLSRTHWMDNFCKKIGVRVAQQNMRTCIFPVNHYKVEQDKITLHINLCGNEDGHLSRLEIHNSGHVFMSYYDLPYDGKSLEKVIEKNSI